MFEQVYDEDFGWDYLLDLYQIMSWPIVYLSSKCEWCKFDFHQTFPLMWTQQCSRCFVLFSFCVVTLIVASSEFEVQNYFEAFCW